MKKCPIDAKTWMKYSLSVWDDIWKSSEDRKVNHPAIFPVALVERLLDCYLWERGVVLDPFMGSGSALVAAAKKGHSGIGVDIVPEFCKMAAERLAELNNLFSESAPIHIINSPRLISLSDCQEFFIINDDARKLDLYVPPNTADIVITSPPYWRVMRYPRTVDKKPPRPYSDLPNDIGNIEDYYEFVSELVGIFGKVARALKENSPCIVILKDIREKNKLFPLHADVISPMEALGLVLTDIIIWNRRMDYNNLAPLGYPTNFYVNKIHEYILIFRKHQAGAK